MLNIYTKIQIKKYTKLYIPNINIYHDENIQRFDIIIEIVLCLQIHLSIENEVIDISVIYLI